MPPRRCPTPCRNATVRTTAVYNTTDSPLKPRIIRLRRTDIALLNTSVIAARSSHGAVGIDHMITDIGANACAPAANWCAGPSLYRSPRNSPESGHESEIRCGRAAKCADATFCSNNSNGNSAASVQLAGVSAANNETLGQNAGKRVARLLHPRSNSYRSEKRFSLGTTYPSCRTHQTNLRSAS